MSGAIRICALALAVAALCSPAFASTTITLQQGLNGYAGTTDAWLDASLERDNYGGAPNLRIRWNDGRDDCAVIKFDLTGVIPPGAEVLEATLALWYYEAGSFQEDNAMTIKPYRLQAGASWDENIYNGQNGVGVSYRYRDAGETVEWTGGAEGGWWDKIDDGNGTEKIKRTGGLPPDAIPPLNWVGFDVTPSVIQWKNGAANHGLLLVATGFEGGGTSAYGLFISRNESLQTYRPRLSITFEPPVSTPKSTWGKIKSLYH
jgi:hypothetical protein